MLTEEARKKRNEYQREYRRSNPSKVKRWNENYWNGKAEKAGQKRQKLKKSEVISNG